MDFKTAVTNGQLEVCERCGKQEKFSTAVESWEPYYWDGEAEHGPICAECAKALNIRFDEESEEAYGDKFHKIS